MIFLEFQTHFLEIHWVLLEQICEFLRRGQKGAVSCKIIMHDADSPVRGPALLPRLSEACPGGPWPLPQDHAATVGALQKASIIIGEHYGSITPLGR